MGVGVRVRAFPTYGLRAGMLWCEMERDMGTLTAAIVHTHHPHASRECKGSEGVVAGLP